MVYYDYVGQKSAGLHWNKLFSIHSPISFRDQVQSSLMKLVSFHSLVIWVITKVDYNNYYLHSSSIIW